MKTAYFKNTFRSQLMIAAVVTLAACSKSERENALPGNQFDGSRQSIQNFVTPELFGIMEHLGVNIHSGNLPPVVNGQYLASELLLHASNIETDLINAAYADTYFTFKEQNRQNLTIDLTYITDNGTESSRGNETVISGNANSFTVFGKQAVMEDEGAADTIIVVSGKLTQEGITDFQFALFMLDNHGVSGFIENKKGRLFYDSDNLAEKQ